jgi:predicted dienelactone hydrolase
MNKQRLVVFLVFVLALILGACAPAVPEPMEEADPPLVVEAPTTPEPIEEMIGEETTPPEPTAEPEPALTFEIPDTEFPLSELGPYNFSILFDVNYIDPQRDNREVSTFIIYPSVDDQPDVRGAPFPLIICDHKIAYLATVELASHGYVVAGINKIRTGPWDEDVFEQPLDYVFVLNQLTENPPEILAGIIDTDHVGVWGFSFGGCNSLVLGGARLDPEYYLENCKNPENFDIDYGKFMTETMMCGPYKNWDAFVQKAGPELTASDDGLWQPITDDRILAVMPMSADGEWLFGPKGLAAVDKAVLMTGGTSEGVMYEDYYRTFKELGTSTKTFISFVKRDHRMTESPTIQAQMRHLAIAFFSHHLKGYEDYGYYYSEAYISQIEGLAYGWYEE